MNIWEQSREEFAGPEPERVEFKEAIWKPAEYKVHQAWLRQCNVHFMAVGDRLRGAHRLPRKAVATYPELQPLWDHIDRNNLWEKEEGTLERLVR
jgi:hypothetical protein